MTILRIDSSLPEAPVRCRWTLVNDGQAPVSGEGPIDQIPRHAERVQLIVPASQVLFTRARLPQVARRRAGRALGFAVEDKIASEPESNHVSWLGTSDDSEVLAVMDQLGLKRWLDALDSLGAGCIEVHCETLLLPWTPGEWSLAWNGHDGYVRTGEVEGAATDSGNRDSPPLSLALMLEEARSCGASPGTIAVFTTAQNVSLDLAAWQRHLGTSLRNAGAWDWRMAPAQAGVSLLQHRRQWLDFSSLLPRMRLAAWIACGALAVHGSSLAVDWLRLANERHVVLERMNARFRSVFPEAAAVADPALQMRRKLADARHSAGQSDGGDFLPMIERTASALGELPAGSLRAVSYESGRLTLEIAAADPATIRRIAARLEQTGLGVEQAIPSPSAGRRATMLTVRAP